MKGKERHLFLNYFEEGEELYEEVLKIICKSSLKYSFDIISISKSKYYTQGLKDWQEGIDIENTQLIDILKEHPVL